MMRKSPLYIAIILVRPNFALQNDVKTDYFNHITELAPLIAQVTEH